MTDKTGYLLHLPIPPLLNNYYGLACNGRMPRKFVKEAGKQYRADILKIIQKKDLVLKANIPMFVQITITPTLKGCDIDSVQKCLFDSLTEAEFWQDDSYIKKMLVDFAPPTTKGSLLVYVEAL